MHELALAQSILDTVERHAREHGIRRITCIRLVVGPLSGAMPEALEFGLGVLSTGTMAEGAEIQIERPLVRALCERCGAEPEMEEWEPCCPDCGAPGLQIRQGDELRIDSFEGE